VSSTDPPRTPDERLAYLRAEYKTLMHIVTGREAGAHGPRHHSAMPLVEAMAAGALARADAAPHPELACEALVQGIAEVMQAAQFYNHMEGTDLAIAYRVCETALQRLIDATEP